MLRCCDKINYIDCFKNGIEECCFIDSVSRISGGKRFKVINKNQLTVEKCERKHILVALLIDLLKMLLFATLVVPLFCYLVREYHRNKGNFTILEASQVSKPLPSPIELKPVAQPILREKDAIKLDQFTNIELIQTCVNKIQKLENLNAEFALLFGKKRPKEEGVEIRKEFRNQCNAPLAKLKTNYQDLMAEGRKEEAGKIMKYVRGILSKLLDLNFYPFSTDQECSDDACAILESQDIFQKDGLIWTPRGEIAADVVYESNYEFSIKGVKYDKLIVNQRPGLFQVRPLNAFCGYYALFFMKQSHHGLSFTDRSMFNGKIGINPEKHQAFFSQACKKIWIKNVLNRIGYNLPEKVTGKIHWLSPSDIKEVIENTPELEEIDKAGNWLIMDNPGAQDDLTATSEIIKANNWNDSTDFPLHIIFSANKHYYYIKAEKIASSGKNHLRLTCVHSLSSSVKESQHYKLDLKQITNGLAAAFSESTLTFKPNTARQNNAAVQI